MINRIIVAYDGSDLSKEAFAYAEALAAAAKVEMLALHVIEPAFTPIIAPDPVVGFDPNPILLQNVVLDAEDRARERSKFTDALRDLEARARVQGVRLTSRIDEGPLVDSLVDEADADDLICVGMKGRFARAGIGSTTKELVADGPCPVMIVGGPFRRLQRVVAVYDGAGASKRAVGWAKGVSQQTNWPIGVLAVSGKRLSSAAALERAREYVSGGEVIHYEPAGQDMSKQIEAAASHVDLGLLAIGAYAESWMHQLLFGSTAMQALTKVKGPIVLVR